AVLVPVRALHEVLEARRVALVDEQIARPLPTEHVVGRIRPRRALIALVAGEEIDEQARLIEVPLAAALLADLEDLAEQLLRPAASPCESAARRPGSRPPARRIRRRPSERPRLICACAGCRPGSRSCRSPSTRGCTGTAARASARADNVCSP